MTESIVPMVLNRCGRNRDPSAVIGAMSSNRVILGELLSSRARPRFPGQPQPATSTPVSSSQMHRTAHRDFLHCLTPGGHPTERNGAAFPAKPTARGSYNLSYNQTHDSHRESNY